jgi:hypothetical protein
MRTNSRSSIHLETTIEALDEGILRGLAWRDIV